MGVGYLVTVEKWFRRTETYGLSRKLHLCPEQGCVPKTTRQTSSVS